MKLNIEIKGDTLLIESLKKIDKKIQKSIIEDLKNSIEKTLISLKSNLKTLVNKEIQGKPIELPNSSSKFTISKKHEIYAKKIFNIDLDNKEKNFKTLKNSNVVVAKKYGNS